MRSSEICGAPNSFQAGSQLTARRLPEEREAASPFGELSINAAVRVGIMPDVLLYAPALVSDNLAIGREVIATLRKAGAREPNVQVQSGIF